MEPLGPHQLWEGEMQLCWREGCEGQDPGVPISVQFVGLLSSTGLAPGSTTHNSLLFYKVNKRR